MVTFAPGIVIGAIGAKPDFRPIKPAQSAQSAAVITAATAMSVKNASEAKTRCFILTGPMMPLPCERNCRRQLSPYHVGSRAAATRSVLPGSRSATRSVRSRIPRLRAAPEGAAPDGVALFG
jgi:hypothetical protein